MDEPVIEHNRSASRFEVHVDGALGVADYRIAAGVMTLTHTEVPARLEGRGLAARLVQAALAHAREQGLRVHPACSYVAAYMRRHRATQDLLEER